MIYLRVMMLSFTIALISSFGGTVRQLPALPNAAVAHALQMDTGGNIYVAGSVPPKSAKSAADASDAFVAKLSPDGSQVLYFTVLAGSSADAASALAVAADGSVYVTGSTSSSDFPVTAGAFQKAYGGQMQQAFVAKLDASGATQYATYIGGTADTAGLGIAIDSAGDAFILGSGAPTGTATIPGGDAEKLGGFVMKLDPAGSKALVSFNGLGGNYIAVDGKGAMYVAGSGQGVPPFTAGAFQVTEAGQACGGTDFVTVLCSSQYVGKADPTGTKLIYLTGLNGTFSATPAGILADTDGNVIVAGTTTSPDFPVTEEAFESIYPPAMPAVLFSSGAHERIVPPPATGYVTKLNATGSALIWSTYFGGATTDSITSMSMDPDGGIVIAGQSKSWDLPGLSGTPGGCLPSSLQELPFVGRLTPDGSAAAPSQLFYGSPANGSGVPVGPISVASEAFGVIVGVDFVGNITAANLFAPSRLACITDPADNVQLSSIAPGQDITVFGSDLAPTLVLLQGQTSVPPKGVSATFNGDQATVLYASPEQVNLQVPLSIAAVATAEMQMSNIETVIPLNETRTYKVVPQQPSVFLTVEALIGAAPSCSGQALNAPLAVALNADGSRNAAANPAASGSKVTIFLNGAAPGSAVTGAANGEPVTFTTEGFNQGVLAASFQVPLSGTNGVTLAQLTAGGAAVRGGTGVAVCVAPQN